MIGTIHMLDHSFPSGLAKAKDTIIGDEMVKGVSGGERKRVAIGVGQ